MRRSFISLCVLAFITALSGCHHGASPENDPAALSALRADVRMVGTDTTWVTRGNGYELVGRSRSDLIAVQSTLDRAAVFLGMIYPGDSLTRITATIRRAPPPGKPSVGAPRLPVDTKGPQVELVVIDQKTLEEQRKKGGGPPPGGGFGGPGASLATPAIRAWLSARATRLTGAPARSDQWRGEADDPRVPAWATEMVAVAGNSETLDNFTKSLAAHPEALIPLSKYFTMTRPEPIAMAGGRRGGGSGGDTGGRGAPGGMGGGGMGGGRGGMGGGRGGMGGGRGGMGGGSSRGGSGSANRNMPLQGMALITAQSAVLSKYLERSGADVVGDLIDAQITGKQIEDVFAKHNMGSLQQIDGDWRAWVLQRGDLLTRR